jgi:hypothetical protein
MQSTGGNLFTDRGLPSGPEERHPAADDEAKGEQEGGRHDSKPGEPGQGNGPGKCDRQCDEPDDPSVEHIRDSPGWR